MCENLSSLSELNYLWKRRGNKNYNLIGVVSGGNFTRYMMFNDRQNYQKVVGKIVTSPREGEAYHWPRLLHENLAPLLEIVAINEATSVYIFPSVGSCLKNVIHDEGFRNDPDCFARKKAYTADILWALDYLHQRSLCIMNLTETIIYISEVADKAVICDFSAVALVQRVSKENMQLPILYQAPEVNSDFQPITVEMWACGVTLLQVFAQHLLPSAAAGNKPIHPVLQAVTEINYDVIKAANPNSSLCQSDIENLKAFLELFLAESPGQRAAVQLAAISSFLNHTKRKSASEIVSLRKCREETNPNVICSYEPTVKKEHDGSIKHTTFKDIYLKEATKYKDKLRRLPSTNKFINLEHVPKVIEEQISAEKLDDMKESRRDVTHVIAHKTSTDSVLPIKNNSESVIEYKNETIPEVLQSEFHELYSTSIEKNNSINLELLQNNSGDAAGSILKNWHTNTCKCYLDNDKLCEDIIDSNSNQFAPGDDFISNKNKCNKSNFKSSYETDISTDSLESLANTEINLSRKQDLNSNSDEIKSISYEKRNESCSCSQNDNEFPKIKAEINLFRVKSESNMKNIRIKNKNLTNFSSDSRLVDSSTEERNETESDLSSSIVRFHSKINNSGQITILGNSNLYQKSHSETEGLKWECHGNSDFKKDVYHQRFQRNIPTPSIDNLSLQNKNKNVEDFLHQNFGNSLKKQYLHKDEDTQGIDARIQQEVENVMFSLRRNSYKRAVSNGLNGISKLDNKKHTKSLFRKRKSIKSKKNSCCSLLSITNIQDFSDSKSNPGNMNLFICSDLESMETSLLNSNMKKRKAKKVKKTWIQCLCLGSKT